MAAPVFGSILKTNPKDVERPKPLPVGTYTCVVNGMPRYDKSTKKGTEFVEFTLKVIDHHDDVDEDELKQVLTKADGKKKTLGDVPLRATFYLKPDILWRLTKFLSDLGIEPKDTLEEMIEETNGSEVVVVVKHEWSDDGLASYARIDSTAPTS